MATISRVHTFSTGEVLTAANLNGELNLIVTAINGNIDAANVDTSAIPTLTATQTLTNKTLTSPKIGTAVLDTAGAELIKLTATGSAVNELTIANAATGNSPTISSTGDDANIDLTLSGKGTGKVIVSGDLQVSGDDLFMGTNTSGHVLIADGTNFNPKALSGDVTVDSSGTTAIESNVIVDADVNASAAIAQSKLALAVTTSEIAAATLVTASEGIGSNDNDTTLPTSAAVKDYVDTQILTEDTLAELNDTTIGSLASGHLLIYDGTDSWDNKAVIGDVLIAADGTTSINSDVIVNADIKSDAAIADSKLATISTSNKVSGSAVQLASTTAIENSSGLQIKSAIAGTGLSLSSQVLSVDAAQTQITSVGTLSSLTVGGNIVSDTDATDDLGLTGTRWRYVYADDIAITNDLAVTEGGTGASTASAARTNLGLGSIATQASDSVSITGGSVTGITDITVADGGTGSSSASGARTNLGVAIGSDVQAYDAGLAAIAGLAVTDGNIIVGNGSTWVAESAGTARTSLGLGSIATQAADNVSISGGSLTGMTSYSGGSFSGTTGTFSGDVAVDTDTLFVDVSADKVSINAGTSPSSALHVQNTGTNAYAIEVDASDGGNLWGVFEDSGGAGQSYLRDADGNPKVVLNSVGDSYFTGGNVGIGTSSAKGLVDIDSTGRNAVADLGDADDYAVVIRNPTTTGQGNGICFTNDDAGNVGGAIVHIDQGSNNTGDLVFYTRDTGGNVDEAMRIDNSQRVGIGVAPAFPLDVDTAGGTNYVAHFRNTTNTSPYTVYIEEPSSATSSLPLLYVGTSSRADFRIDSAGRRIGMGVSPNVDMHSNNSLYLQLPNNVFRWSRSTGSFQSSNFYYNLSDAGVFAANGYALTHSQNTTGGAFYWNISTASNSSGAGASATLATKMYLDNTGAGLGTVSPLAKIHTATGTANLSSVTGSTQAVFEHTAAAGSVSRVAIIGGSGSGYSVLDFGDTSGSNNGGITYNHGDDSMSFATTNGTTKMSIQSGTEVWIANTSDQGSYNLQVGGTGVWGAGAYVNGSDEKIKQQITTYDDDATELVSQMRPVTFEYTEEYSRDRATQVGFIAQDLQQVLEGKNYADGIVKEDANQLNVAYQSIIPILTKAVQELTQRVKELESN